MWTRLDFPALPTLVWSDDAGRGAAVPVLFLHGMGERGTDGWGALRHGLPTVLPARPPRPMRVVVPQCPPDCRWGDRLAELAGLLDAMRIDRLTVAGFSMGGQGVWAFAANHPDRVARLAPVSGRLPAGMPASDLASCLPQVPTWVIHGARDESVPVTESDAAVAALRALGRPATFTRYERLGHMPTCEKAYADDEYLAWLAATESSESGA